MKSLHDAVDGLSPHREQACDGRGFSKRGEHRFRAALGAAAVWERFARERHELRAALDTYLVSLPEYGEAGHETRAFSEGNLSEFGVAWAYSEARMAHYEFFARVVAAGFHHRHLVYQPGAGVRGHEFVLGALVGTDYLLHRYERDQDSVDRALILDAPAVRFMWRASKPAQRFELRLDAGLAMGGIDALALRQFDERKSRAELTSIAEAHGYNHVIGVGLAPMLRFTTAALEVQAMVRSHRLWAVRALDREPSRMSRIPVTETLRRSELSLTWLPCGTPLRPSLTAGALQRWGSLGDVRARRSELSLAAGLAVWL